MYGAKVSMSLSSSFSIMICTFLLFSVCSGPCVLGLNLVAIQRNFQLFFCLLYIARQCWFPVFVCGAFIPKIGGNLIGYTRPMPILVTANFLTKSIVFLRLLLLIALFNEHSSSTRSNFVAHTATPNSLLTFSSIFWASRQTSCSTAFGYSIIKGTMSQLGFTFHIPWHFFAWLFGHRS